MKTLNKPLAMLAGLTLSASAWSQQLVDTGAVQPLDTGKSAEKSVYIVQVKGDPILAYEGGIAGYVATKPGKGKKVNPNSAHVRKYAGYLDSQHAQTLASAGGGELIYNYRYALNGFAAMMTPRQAEALRASGQVQNVWKDEMMEMATDNSPDFINLTEGGEAWSKGWTGEDVIIGVVDSGVWPEHPSIADTATPQKGNKGPLIPYGPPPAGWSGTDCEFGNEAYNPADAPFACNNKLLGAKAFGDSFKSVNTLHPFEFDSARDADSHGTHTLTTAGGNNGVPAGDTTVSGIAPRARVAAYKSCWTNDQGQGGCFNSDSAAAIDQAVADGVDVINFSVGGSSTFFATADAIAFLFADNAGVFVATSNGNAGPGPQTTGTPAGVPWITAVGATQDNNVFGLVVSVHSPTSVAGAKEALEGVSPVQLADTGTISGDVELTDPPTGCSLPTNDLTGKIALSIRGGCSFSSKYNNAAAAGASAIIVYNDGLDPSRVDPITMSAPGTSIPGVMIGFFDGEALAAETGVTATLDPAALVSRESRIAGFSSRGPNGGAPDVIKPDVAAPGVSILAGVSGGGFGNLSGTSMASPHVAGAFALLKQAHPDWTPAMARSALMTTARQDLKKTFGEAPADPFDIGAGEIQPSNAFDPGLAYDAGLFEYAAFSCENNAQIFSDASCAFLESIGVPSDASDLNLPSIGIAQLAGSQTVTRTVTNVANNSGNKSFTVSVEAPPGIDVSVSPTTLKLKPGQSASYEVTFSANSQVVPEQWTFGSLTWRHGAEYAVRSPIAIYPVAFAAPEEVSGAGTDGSLNFQVGFGYEGEYVASASGLVPASTEDGNVPDDPGNSFAFFGPGTTLHLAEVPAGTEVARWALFNEYTDGDDDLDLYVYHCPGSSCTLVGQSGNADSNETVTLLSPAPAELANGDVYAIFVHGWETDGPDANYRLFNWTSGPDAGNMVITGPSAAALGSTGTVTVDWAGLDTGHRYLGAVGHGDGSGTIAHTIVTVSTE